VKKSAIASGMARSISEYSATRLQRVCGLLHPHTACSTMGGAGKDCYAGAVNAN
jgi:hypothetical protein